MTESAENQKSDEEIASQVQAGDIDAFGVLVERYEAKLKRYGRKFLLTNDDADDLVQEVFIKAYTNIRSFKPSKRFSPWIYRIAHNHFINSIKKKKNAPMPFFDPESIFPHPIAPETADAKAKQNDDKRLIAACLDKLKPKYREAMVLYYLEELSYQEISDILRIPIKTVGVRLNRARTQVQEIYQNINQ